MMLSYGRAQQPKQPEQLFWLAKTADERVSGVVGGGMSMA
jgi:hypothetical protein